MFWIKHKKFKKKSKKNQKNLKPSHCVMLCDLVSRKNNKLAIYVFTWQTMLPKKVFHFFFTKKPFSIFSVPEREFFVKHVPRIRFKMVPHHFCKILDHILSTIHQPVASKSFPASSQKKDKFMSIYEEPCRIWTISAS